MPDPSATFIFVMSLTAGPSLMVSAMPKNFPKLKLKYELAPNEMTCKEFGFQAEGCIIFRNAGTLLAPVLSVEAAVFFMGKN
jgi:hypothetical protein